MKIAERSNFDKFGHYGFVQFTKKPAFSFAVSSFRPCVAISKNRRKIQKNFGILSMEGNAERYSGPTGDTYELMLWSSDSTVLGNFSGYKASQQ